MRLVWCLVLWSFFCAAPPAREDPNPEPPHRLTKRQEIQRRVGVLRRTLTIMWMGGRVSTKQEDRYQRALDELLALEDKLGYPKEKQGLADMELLRGFEAFKAAKDGPAPDLKAPKKGKQGRRR